MTSAPQARAETAVRGRLPAPGRRRWQPLRLGLLNLYRFDEEVFHFEDGRLLLRGNNGTGKSRVLALTLPFLLDGRIEPHRVEPDGDAAKRMEWNLLMGRHDDRLGYTWMELGRQPDPADNGDEGPRFVTIGCGLRATAGRGAPRRWYFVTDQRVGQDLQLVAETGQALTRDRLAEAVGERGVVVETATEYRRAVDRALFRLGAERYEALVDLLVQLRRPQLSRQLDESLLSAALSEALPPLAPATVADVAEAFRALDDDRDALDGFRAALQASETFLAAYRTYGAVASRRRATAVTQAHSRYERTRAELRDAERRRAEAEAEVGRLETRRDALLADERAAGVEVHTLETSPEMEAARELAGARQRADELAGAASTRADDAQQAAAEVERRGRETERIEGAVDISRAGVTRAQATAVGAAEAAALASVHARTLEVLGLPDGRDAESLAAARASLDREVARVRRAAEHLVALDAQVRAAAAQLGTARQRLDERASELDRARDAARQAETALGTARATTTTALRAWAAELTVLAGIVVEEVAEELQGWDGAGAGPAAVAGDAALARARDGLSRQAAELETRARELAAQHRELAAERAAVAAGTHRPPPAPHTRDPEARRQRPGAPLWRLVDPVAGIDGATLAGYEAALEASGLLDAWVTLDGDVLDANDTVLVAAGTPARADGGLGAVLAPATAPGDDAAAAVPATLVTALLARIGARADGEVWVGGDGRWRVGVLHGRWHKAAPEHLGNAAREAARQRRLAELEVQLAALQAQVDGVAERRSEVDARRRRGEAERAAAPDEDAVRQAVYAVDRSALEARHHAERVAATEAEVQQLHEALEQAEGERTAAAADLGLAERAADPAQLLADLAEYRAALGELWPALDLHADRLGALEAARGEQARAAAGAARRHEQARAASQSAADAATRRDTLEAAVGATAAEVIARVEAARARQAQLGEALAGARAERESQLLARQSAATQAEAAERQLDEQGRIRAQEVEHLRRLAQGGFLRVAGVELEADVPAGDAAWASEPSVRAARRVNEALHDVSAEDGDWERVQRGLHGHYTALEQALLPHNLPPAGTFDDDLFVVTAAFQGRPTPIRELRDLLADEVMHRQSVLDAREREVLENHLVGEVATQLHELIRGGETLVADMNAELASRPTSTGMRLRFSWRPRPDGPEALADARRRLLQVDHVWSAADREALGAFLQARIREVREADDLGTWQEHLTRALDYRRWHLFAVERQQEGSWVRLTRRTHGTGSGGEKALALTVPQFAAAAAHYRSADPQAPRIIALDEAFVGIDNDMRAKCMDLLTQFDLDVVMTSEREWACYPTVPAIAIYQLSSRAGIDAVGVHRWVWNGRERLEVRVAEAQEAG